MLDVSKPARERAWEESRQLSMAFFYWMQTEAPRPDGGAGYPGLYLKPEVMGTQTGLAMMPYIRESRRIQACFTVCEQHIGVEARKGQRGAETFPDSVGLGAYGMDLHPTTGGDNYIGLHAWPFQIPLRSLVPVRMRNLLPACKNAGVTHLTNGCYRVHPPEWNIGEAAGLLAAYCLARGTEHQAVSASEDLTADFQQQLQREGVELTWPEIDPIG